MNMKKIILTAFLLGATVTTVNAQDDDLYFVPTKKNIAKERASYGLPEKTYYSGSKRSVDDYNRRTWEVAGVPADSDIIDFSAVRGVYPDSAYSEQDSDYQLTRKMTRFDDYTPDRAYWDGYRAGRWSSPWYSSWYSWYDPWYEPWYFDAYYGWGSPWYYSSWYSPWHYGWGGYWGWHGGYWDGPRYHGGGISRPASRIGVTHHKTQSAGRGTNLGGYRSSRQVGGSTSNSSSSRNYGTRSLGGSRSGTGSSMGNSSGSFGGSSSGSFGGSRSNGSSGGGRSTGGGHSYGGRR